MDIDEIYHIAASENIGASATDTTTDIKNNVLGTHVVLDLMRKKILIN